MMKYGLLWLFVACLTSSPLLWRPLVESQSESRGATTTPAQVLDDFHLAAAEADGARYFSHFGPDAIFLGTDGSERWTVEEFRSFAEPYFSQGRGWTYTVKERHVSSSSGGDVAWFDEVLNNEKYGECRGTGVLVRVDESWKIAQYNLTIPVPNAFAGQVVRAAKGLNVAPTTIYLVRHAEKLDEPRNPNPHLSERGRTQANQLRAMLRHEGIDAIYITPYQRTHQTVEPTAVASGVEPVEIGGRATAELIERLTNHHAGESVLVAGHSNTVPMIIRGLGVDRDVVLSDQDYGDVFVITLDGRGGASMIRLRFSVDDE